MSVPPDPAPEPGGPSRSTAVALVFVVALLLGAIWLVQAIQTHLAAENCLNSGRRDCASLR